MEKISNWFKSNLPYLTLGLSVFVTALIAYLGFKKGVEKSDRSKKEVELSALRTKVENVILKEKIADKQKDISEISKDVDDILDRK